MEALANIDLSFWMFLVVCPLCFIAGFIDAIGGGGGLISIPAFLFVGIPVHQALGTNKLQSSLGTLIATIKYARNGYMIWWLCGLCIITAFAGSALGANLTLLVSEKVLKVFMLVVIPFVAFYVLRKKDFGEGKAELSKRRTAITSMVIAFVVGIYDGFYGPGTGTFLMLLLCGVAHMDINHAAGTTKTINLTTNVAALVVFIANGTVIFTLGLIAAVFNIAGNYLGARFFTNKGATIVRPVVLTVLVIFFIKIILELLGIL